MADYFKRVAAMTPTQFWINNVTEEEARMAIEAGAVGCTQNPSFAYKMLVHPTKSEEARKVLRQILKEVSILLMNCFAPLIDHCVVARNIKKRQKRALVKQKTYAQ